MVTQKLTREVVEQGIEHFDDNDWRVAASAPEFKDFYVTSLPVAEAHELLSMYERSKRG